MISFTCCTATGSSSLQCRVCTSSATCKASQGCVISVHMMNTVNCSVTHGSHTSLLVYCIPWQMTSTRYNTLRICSYRATHSGSVIRIANRPDGSLIVYSQSIFVPNTHQPAPFIRPYLINSILSNLSSRELSLHCKAYSSPRFDYHRDNR